MTRVRGGKLGEISPTGSACGEETGRERLMPRREFLRLAGAVSATAALSACGVTRAAPSIPNTENVQLVYQDASTDWFPPMAHQMLEQFHASHPNIQVFYVPEPDNPQDKEQKMLADMQAGSAPDVMQGCCTWFPIWAQKGYMLDLRPYVKADIDKATIDDWDPAQYNSFFTADGKQYGLPKYHGALALYYNKDLFDKYKVGYPDGSWNHDDYLSAMKLLTHHDMSGRTKDLWGSMFYITWDRIQMHVNGWGGHLVDPKDPRRCLISQPEAMAAMEWLRARMWDDKVMASMLDVQKKWPCDAFVAGQIAMVEDGSWELKDILTRANFHVGVAPFPAGPVRRVTLATTDGFGIYAGTKHPEAAWELMKFLISKDYGRAMAKANLLQPARASLVDEWISFVRQEFPGKAKDMDIAAFADGHRKHYSVVGEVAANMADATRIADAAWDKVYTLGQASTDAMKNACLEIEKSQGNTVGDLSCCS